MLFSLLLLFGFCFVGLLLVVAVLSLGVVCCVWLLVVWFGVWFGFVCMVIRVWFAGAVFLGWWVAAGVLGIVFGLLFACILFAL